MERVYCDLCLKCISGPEDGMSSLEDLFQSRRFVMLDANDETRQAELTLCAACKKATYYYMKNHDALRKDVRNMKLGNRLRYLFKMPLKSKGGKDDGEGY